jgi:hypothetical protein
LVTNDWALLWCLYVPEAIGHLDRRPYYENQKEYACILIFRFDVLASAKHGPHPPPYMFMQRKITLANQKFCTCEDIAPIQIEKKLPLLGSPFIKLRMRRNVEYLLILFQSLNNLHNAIYASRIPEYA